MNMAFFGTPQFVLPILDALHQTKNMKLTAVVTTPDQPVGRHSILTPSPVKLWAQEYQIPVIDSAGMIQIMKLIEKLKPDLGILAAYGKIIPKELIVLFPRGILVIHPSLLPKYRGPTPVPSAILAGEKETGVTIIKMDQKVDHGPIVAQFSQEIKPEDTAETLLRGLFSAAAETLVTILPAYIESRIKIRPQDESGATYTKILRREDGYIDLENLPPPEMVDRMIRAFHPWPGVWTKLKVKSARLPDGQEKLKVVKFLPGKLIQVEGGKPMTVRDFLNGYPEAKSWLPKIFPA